MYSTYFVFFEAPVIMMFLSGITGIGNMIADYERNQIYNLAQQREEAITMKLLPEQIQEKGGSENEKLKIAKKNNNHYNCINSIMAIIITASRTILKPSSNPMMNIFQSSTASGGLISKR